MNAWLKIIIGATGGISAVLTKFMSQDINIVSHYMSVHDPRLTEVVIGYAFLTPILVFLGAIVSWIVDETDKKKLFMMAVAAPALITTYNVTPAPPLQPNQPIGPAGWNFQISPVASAFAADENIKTAQQAPLLQKGVAAFFGSGKGEQYYWVIVGSFKDKDEATALSKSINEQNKAMKAFVGKRAPNNEFYPVIVGGYSALEDANRLKDAASKLEGVQEIYLSAFPDRVP